VHRRLKTVALDGRNYYEINEKQKMFSNQRVDETALVEIGDYLTLCSHELTRCNPEGDEIEKWKINFDEPSWKYPQNTFNKTAFAVILPSFVEQYLSHHVKEQAFYYWLNDQQIFKMILKVQGRERITTKMGNSRHVRIKMVPDVRSIMPVGKSLAPLIQPLIPGVHIWDSEDRTRFSMKMEGMIGPPGSPKMRVEIVDQQMG